MYMSKKRTRFPYKSIIVCLPILYVLTCQSSQKVQNQVCKTVEPIQYTHAQKESLTSKFLKFGISFLGMKEGLEKAKVKNSGKKEADPPPASLQKDFIFTVTKYKERVFWTISPKERTTDKIILYFHGGAYINNINKYQWNMIEEIARKTNAKVIIPDYPLAPESQYDKVYSFLESIYTELLLQTKANSILFLGDSAGGGLALGLSQKLYKEKKQVPSQIILIAPWLDVTMSDPEIQKIDPLDQLLNVNGLVWAGKIYAGSQSTKDPLISPIYGDTKGLGKISIFIGTHDMLYPDSLRLKKNLEVNQIDFNYFEYPAMFHVWPVMIGMQEADSAIDQISRLVLCGI